MENTDPKTLAILRLSALGDILLCSAIVKHLSIQLPNTKITWFTDTIIIPLLEPMPNVTLVPLKKPKGLRDYLQLKQQLKAYTFDVLLCAQASFRINLIYKGIKAKVKIGFDQRRGRDLHGCFIQQRIPYRDNHLVEGMAQFAEKIGHQIPRDSHGKLEIKWPISIPDPLNDWAKQTLKHLHPNATADQKWLAICICASKPERSWPVEKLCELLYQLLATTDANIILVGGPSEVEIKTNERILQSFTHERTETASTPATTTKPKRQRIASLVGKTSIPQLAAMLANVTTTLTPDTGPMHLSNAVGTPVVGLFAVARPELTGPYNYQHLVVNSYPQAIKRFSNLQPETAPWHYRVHDDRAMQLINVEKVMAKLQPFIHN